MSAKMMGEVWELHLPFNQAWVLMAYADHADHLGRNAFPSLPLVAWKTGYSVRQVGRIVGELKEKKILVEDGKTYGGVKIYHIVTRHCLRKGDYVEPENGRPAGGIEKVPREGY